MFSVIQSTAGNLHDKQHSSSILYTATFGLLQMYWKEQIVYRHTAPILLNYNWQFNKPPEKVQVVMDVLNNLFSSSEKCDNVRKHILINLCS